MQQRSEEMEYNQKIKSLEEARRIGEKPEKARADQKNVRRDQRQGRTNEKKSYDN